MLKKGLWIVAVVLFSSCQQGPAAPRANHGLFDASLVDFNHRSLDLDGTWLFYPEHLLDPTALSSTTVPSISLLVPSLWESQDFGGHLGPDYGMGTYALEVKLPDHHPPLMIRTNSINCAFAIYLNGINVWNTLQGPNRTLADLPATKPHYFQVDQSVDHLSIVIAVENYWDAFGSGLDGPISLGDEGLIEQNRDVYIGLEAFLAGVLILAAIYHFILYSFQRRDASLLWFGLACLGMLARLVSITERFWISVAGFNHDAILRLSAVSVWWVCFALLPFFYEVIGSSKLQKQVLRSLLAVGVICIPLHYLTPIEFVTATVPELQAYVLLTIAYITWLFGPALKRRASGTWTLLAGVIVLEAASVVDIVMTNIHEATRAYGPMGIVPFVALFSYTLARRYTKQALEAEQLRLNNQRMEELDKAKTSFFANISHELRTPLTLVHAPLLGIQLGEYGPSLETGHPVFQMMRTNTSRILKLVENLLKVARLESGAPIHRETTSLDATLDGWCEGFRAVAGARQVLLEFRPGSDDFEVSIDVQDFETVMFNLLSNAVKYSPSGAVVVVTRDSRPEPGQMIKISVADTGPGISAERQKTLFERFRSVYDFRQGQYSGTGIGLSIARETARRLGGDLSVTSQEGQGATFSLTFPYLVPDAASTGEVRTPESATLAYHLEADFPNPEAPSSNPGRGNLLVVDDNSELREFVASLLRRDHDVLTAQDGAEALNLLAEHPEVSLVVTDIMMPRMDGIALFKAANNLGDPLPFIFLTARADEAERLDMLQSGVLDYVYKPFSPLELRAKVANILRLQQTRSRVTEDRIAKMLHGAAPETQSVDFGLTLREKEVLALVFNGLSDKEIADKLDLSPRTASNHVASLLRKTGHRSRVELVVTLAKRA